MRGRPTTAVVAINLDLRSYLYHPYIEYSYEMIDPIYPAGRTKFRSDIVDFANNSKNPESKIREFTVFFRMILVLKQESISFDVSQPNLPTLEPK